MVYELLVLEYFLLLEWELKVFGWDFFLILKQKSWLNIAIKQSHFQHMLRRCNIDCSLYTSNQKSYVWRTSQTLLGCVCDQKQLMAEGGDSES